MKLCIRQGFVFQLLKDKMFLLFLEKSYVPLHLCYIRSSFITTSLIRLRVYQCFSCSGPGSCPPAGEESHLIRDICSTTPMDYGL